MYFDTHAHYDDAAFDPDRDALLSSLPEAGVTLVVDPGCDVLSSEKAVALADRYPHVYAAVGIHPEELGKMQPGDLEKIEALCQSPKCVAIGEIGLDYYWDDTHKEEQKALSLPSLSLRCVSASPSSSTTARPTGTAWTSCGAIRMCGACSTAIPALRRWRRSF